MVHTTFQTLQSRQKTKRIRRTFKVLGVLLIAAVIVTIVAVIIFFIVSANTTHGSSKIPRGAVVTNGHQCAEIGASILEKGGTAVDAAVAALFCEGVSMPQSMGIGGGFLMTIYIRETRKAFSLNARETAPEAAHEDMFDGNSTLSTRGGLAVAIPGELRGYWEAYTRFGGNISWADLVQPTIDLCENGILVTEYLAKLYASQKDILLSDPGLREAFINPLTNDTYHLNEKVRRPRLAKTLKLIATEGIDVLYNGSLTASFVKDIQDNGGNITVEDMTNYKAEWQDPLEIEMPFDERLFTTPLPGSGVILGFVMNILKGFIDFSLPDAVVTWQRVVESFKWGYARRTELGDTNYVDIKDLLSNLTSEAYATGVREKIDDQTTSQDPSFYGANTTQPNDSGTAHVSVLAPNGDAVSVTSTINLYFGAKFMSLSTGIILNDEMDDFSAPNVTNAFGIPPSIANFIKPGKRPLSSMCPSIIVDQNGDVELIVGAAGGTKITSSVALVAMKNLWFNMSIQAAVSDKRLHHQLFPMYIEFEEDYNNDLQIPNALHEIGHEFEIVPSTGFSAVTAISRKDNLIRTATDKRRSGEAVIVY